MIGINLNTPINYRSASFRYFAPSECHIERTCSSNVLLLVFEGVLRFNENGTNYEIHAGEYFIQKKGAAHSGPIPSDCPKYLYAHFNGEWQTDGEDLLPEYGQYSYRTLSPIMEKLDQAAHENSNYLTQATYFYQILSALFRRQVSDLLPANAQLIAKYIEDHYLEGIALPELCDEFHFSKNHIIKLIKKAYGVTPIEYLNNYRIQRAQALLEITSEKTETVASAVGFQNYSHFYRLFLNRTGLSPSDYRTQKRKQ